MENKACRELTVHLSTHEPIHLLSQTHKTHTETDISLHTQIHAQSLHTFIMT